MSTLKSIHAGLTQAEQDYIRISKFINYDVKPKEDQIKCAIYRALCDSKYLVHVEARYPKASQRCDLIAINLSTDERIAIEIKTAWAGRNWVNKPKEQASTWRADIEKLLELQENGWVNSGYFILCFAYEEGSPAERKLRGEAKTLGGTWSTPFSISNWNGLNKIQFLVLDVFETLSHH